MFQGYADCQYISLRYAGVEICLPSPDDLLLPGLKWGNVGDFFTAAFWKHQAVVHDARGLYRSFSLGSSLREELAACLLGGHGIPAELGLAAYDRLRTQGLLEGQPCLRSIEHELCRPFRLNGSSRKYRFARQKARYLAGSLSELDDLELPTDHVRVRDLLSTLPGIGPKTASWIVRNHYSSDEVAILDIHIIRACVRMGLFTEPRNIARQYRELEKAFLSFCVAIEVPASQMDALMWDLMRTLSPLLGLQRESILPQSDRRGANSKEFALHSENGGSPIVP